MGILHVSVVPDNVSGIYKFRFIWLLGFRGEDLLEIGHQKQELPVVAMFVNKSGRNVQSL
jgi:hypothetical protein